MAASAFFHLKTITEVKTIIKVKPITEVSWS